MWLLRVTMSKPWFCRSVCHLLYLCYLTGFYRSLRTGLAHANLPAMHSRHMLRGNITPDEATASCIIVAAQGWFHGAGLLVASHSIHVAFMHKAKLFITL